MISFYFVYYSLYRCKGVVYFDICSLLVETYTDILIIVNLRQALCEFFVACRAPVPGQMIVVFIHLQFMMWLICSVCMGGV